MGPHDYIPPRPTGNTAEARFMQWVWDVLTRWLRVVSTSTVKANWTSGGLSFRAARQKGGSAPSAGMNFKGEWDNSIAYSVGDVVVIRTGSNAGSFVCVAAVAPGGTAPTYPDTGNAYWVALSPGDTIGQWL